VALGGSSTDFITRDGEARGRPTLAGDFDLVIRPWLGTFTGDLDFLDATLLFGSKPRTVCRVSILYNFVKIQFHYKRTRA
jgi:hypothetical protein